MVQAALVIRGFDYSRTRKQGKTANNERNYTVFAELIHELVVFDIHKFLIFLETNTRE
jgi:hypothetical protein